eukprot:6224043-Pyramimonas_sp.AAC.1
MQARYASQVYKPGVHHMQADGSAYGVGRVHPCRYWHRRTRDKSGRLITTMHESTPMAPPPPPPPPGLPSTGSGPQVRPLLLAPNRF